MRARRALDFREFSPVRGSGPVRVLVRLVTGTYCAPASSTYISRMRNSNSLGVVGQYRLPLAISFKGTSRSLTLVFCLLCASYGATRSSRGEHV